MNIKHALFGRELVHILTIALHLQICQSESRVTASKDGVNLTTKSANLLDVMIKL
jgi:hypothetical protein